MSPALVLQPTKACIISDHTTSQAKNAKNIAKVFSLIQVNVAKIIDVLPQVWQEQFPTSSIAYGFRLLKPQSENKRKGYNRCRFHKQKEDSKYIYENNLLGICI